MSYLSFRGSFPLLLTVGFLTAPVIGLGEGRCPANVQGVHARIVAGALLLVPVKIGDSGPFEFIVDTGSQLNVIDPSLADQLGIQSQSTVGLVTASRVLKASAAVLPSLHMGSFAVEKPLVAIQDLGTIQASDPSIRGVLGENFLSHFDVFIDYPHEMVCIGGTNTMDEKVRGERIPFTIAQHEKDEPLFSVRIVVSVSLPLSQNRAILLQVDSGSDGAILYPGREIVKDLVPKQPGHEWPLAKDRSKRFAALPPQMIRIGNRTVGQILFVTPIGDALETLPREEDGILATVLFRRIYINHSNRYIVFDPT